MQAIVGVDGEQRFLGLRVGILRFVQGGSSFVHVLTKCYDQLGGGMAVLVSIMFAVAAFWKLVVSRLAVFVSKS